VDGNGSGSCAMSDSGSTVLNLWLLLSCSWLFSYLCIWNDL